MKQIIKKELERKILLNPGPASTSVRVKKALITPDICPREKEFFLLLQEIKKKSLIVVNGTESYECILLGSSGTGAIESTLGSCVDSTDKILIIENGAYGRRMKQICDNLSISSEVIAFKWNTPIDPKKIDEILSKKAEKFRVLAFVHHETTSGVMNPLSEICSLAKKYQLVCLVDAMSSYAGIPIDLTIDSVDYLISSSNKCIQGMAGVGIVIAKSSELDAIKYFPKKNFYFDLYQNYISQKETGQFLFTPPVQILYALHEALDEFLEEGGTSRFARYARLHKLLYHGMKKLGLSPLLDESVNSKILTSFMEPDHPHYSFEIMHDYLYERGITIYPGKLDTEKTFRISNMGDLHEEDIQNFLQVINNYLKESDIRLK